INSNIVISAIPEDFTALVMAKIKQFDAFTKTEANSFVSVKEQKTLDRFFRVLLGTLSVASGLILTVYYLTGSEMAVFSPVTLEMVAERFSSLLQSAGTGINAVMSGTYTQIIAIITGLTAALMLIYRREKEKARA
ncbi:MAG: hypothetical protein FWE82_09175, partial [Defluviitaleaceae bacterium]|nr:hypothetical protein [Defluviitaleaceae bacterium]